MNCAKCTNPIGPHDEVIRGQSARGNTVFDHASCFWKARAMFLAGFVRLLGGAVAAAGGSLRIRPADLARAGEHKNEITARPPDESGDIVVVFTNAIVRAADAVLEVRPQ